MDNNSWLQVAIVAFLIFYCLPMFMGRRSKRSSNVPGNDKGISSRGSENTERRTRRP